MKEIKMIEYDIYEFIEDVNKLASSIIESNKKYSSIYAIPAGGIALAIKLSDILNIPICQYKDINDKTLIVDDLVDSGKTRDRFIQYDFACIHVKKTTPKKSYPTYWINCINQWINYWWENNDKAGIENNIIRILEFIGEDPVRIGLKETPARVAKMYKEIFRGYDTTQKPVITCFPNGQDGIFYNEMLIDEGYFFSHCEHHMVPFFGGYHYSYIPDKMIIGASKIARTIDYYSARLQVAERLVAQVVNEIEQIANPLGQILVMKARHLCKEMRGVKKVNSPFTAIAVRGYFAQNRNGCKDEFMSRIQG